MSSQATVELKRPTRASSAAAGRLSVGDYVGESAAHAAQCVRRAGLRPALERSLGCDPALIGTIIAQEPHAGDEQMRNGMVTLFVAAPGPALAPEAGERSTPRKDRAHTSIGRRDGTLSDSSASVSRSDVRRSRKRRHGACAEPPSFDPPPAPVVGVREPQDQTGLDFADDGLPLEHTAQWTAGEQASIGPSEETREQERLAEHLQDVFAGRMSDSRARRRVYPRRPIGAISHRPLAWARSHPVVALTAAATVLVWIAVAVASAVGGHAVGTRGAGVISRGAPEVASSGAPPAVPAVRVATRHLQSDPPPRASTRPRRSLRRRMRARSARSREPQASEQSTAVPSSIPPRSGTSEPEQARGGPFSP